MPSELTVGAACLGNLMGFCSSPPAVNGFPPTVPTLLAHALLPWVRPGAIQPLSVVLCGPPEDWIVSARGRLPKPAPVISCGPTNIREFAETVWAAAIKNAKPRGAAKRKIL